MTTSIPVYRVVDSRYEDSSRLVLTLHPFRTITLACQEVMEYLWECKPDQAARYVSQSSRWRSPRLNRIRKTQGFVDWSIQHQYTVRTELYGYASCEHDGRLSPSSVRLALLSAVQDQTDEVRIYPQGNSNKPAHERMVYVTRLHLTLV